MNASLRVEMKVAASGKPESCEVQELENEEPTVGCINNLRYVCGVCYIYTNDTRRMGCRFFVPANGLRGSWGGALHLRRCPAGETV